jgi:two-component sensor histidine kinase
VSTQRIDLICTSRNFFHRVPNEYTCAISLANRLAARSAHEETKTALAQIINCLHALAASHQMLRPPLTTASADLSANLTQLCRAMTSSRLADRDIELHLAVTEPVMLDAERCWRAALIISELITNASRHAFTSQEGRISVAVEMAARQIICRVSDDGSPTATLKRGLGSELIDALAADLDGYVERIHKASGTTITLFFPQVSMSHQLKRSKIMPAAKAVAGKTLLSPTDRSKRTAHQANL